MITYLKGDATKPEEHPDLKGQFSNFSIVHVCNDIGAWGKGFVMAISDRSKEPERSYKKWANLKGSETFGKTMVDGKEYYPFNLSYIDVVPISGSVDVVNLIGQEGIYPDNGVPPVRYEAIKRGLFRFIVNELFDDLLDDPEAPCTLKDDRAICMPRIGCGLAGGDWLEIEKILLGLEALFGNLNFFVFDL